MAKEVFIQRKNKPIVYVQYQLAAREKYPKEIMDKHEAALTAYNKSCRLFDELICKQYDCVYGTELGDDVYEERLLVHTEKGDVSVNLPYGDIHEAVLRGIPEDIFVEWLTQMMNTNTYKSLVEYWNNKY